MKQDHPELPEEISQALGRLGRATPPEPAVLDAAREILWAAVAAEMLPEAAGEHDQIDETGGSRRVAQPETAQPETAQPETAQPETAQRDTDQPGQVGRLRPGDPGA